MTPRNVVNSSKYTKVDKHYYRDGEGILRKYSHICVEENCLKISSFNYRGMKSKYCNDHKKIT